MVQGSEGTSVMISISIQSAVPRMGRSVHRVAGKNVPLRIQNDQRGTGHDFDILGLGPAGGADALSKQRGIDCHVVIREPAGLERPIGAIDRRKIIGRTGRCEFDETFDMPCRRSVGGPPDVGIEIVGKSIISPDGGAKSEKSRTKLLSGYRQGFDITSCWHKTLLANLMGVALD